MLEKVDLTRTYPKASYKKEIPARRRYLYDLQRAAWSNKIPILLLFEGWDAAGKGSTIAALTSRLDPRGYRLYPITPPRTYETQYPWLWRFWLKTPGHGEMAIFDRSWYIHVLDDVVDKRTTKNERERLFLNIQSFERMLADDGTVIIKFFLHISKKEQKKRFKQITKDPLESWRVSEEDWARHKKYGKYLKTYESMLEHTDTEWGPWTIVEATDRWFARHKVFETVINRLEEALGDNAPPPPILPEKVGTLDDDDHLQDVDEAEANDALPEAAESEEVDHA